MWITAEKLTAWKCVKEMAVGGLEWIGFSKERPNQLLCISSQKDTLIDCRTGIFSECDCEYDELSCSALCSLLPDETVKISGQYGGVALRLTSRGEKVRTEAAPENQTAVYFTDDSGEEHLIFKDYGFYTCGFSYDGEYFVFAQDAGITLLSRRMKVMFDGFDFTNFWDTASYAEEYESAFPSDELIESIERELGYKLPASYIWLMKQHNGGIPVNACYPTNVPTSWAEDHVAIAGIFGIGREKTYSLCGSLGSQFMIDEWEYPAIGVAICDCPSAGHDMIFLDYRECGAAGEPKVVHIDQEEDYKITPLADNFEEFIRGLVSEQSFEPDETDSGSAGFPKHKPRLIERLLAFFHLVAI